MDPPLHPAVAPLGFLLGTWTGVGQGQYPTIDPFEYAETVEVTHVGKPFLAYRQQTWHPADRSPMHAETGYLRLAGPGAVEAVIAHPTGIGEVLAGPVDGGRVRLRSTAVTRTATAKEVVAVERDLVVDGEILTYEVRMAAVGHPLTHHLAALLHRRDGDRPTLR